MTKEIFKTLSFGIPKSDKKRVVIIGGGFAGIKFAKGLQNKGFQVVLVDRSNYHNFQPLLYQVATAGLEPDSIAEPLRKLFDNYQDFYFRMVRITKINPEKNTVSSLIGELHYDYLVIATGSRTNFFDNQQFISNSFPLKQIPHALDLRSQILQNFEKATMTKNGESEEGLMNFVLVGGGPTGVELSGALGELKNHILPSDYPDIDFKRMQIYLIEGHSRLLGAMSEKSGAKALKDLKRFDVKVILNTVVKDYKDNVAYLSTGQKIPTETLIWAAGVKGNLIEGLPEDSLENSRIIVDEYNRVKNSENIFAIGDISLFKSEKFPRGYPMMAPPAIQEGKHLAKNFVYDKQGKKMKPFNYLDKGSLATIGRNKAVVDLPGGISFGGFAAWFIWMFVHLVYISGFRNKFVVFINWVWNYITYDRGNRLIMRLFLHDGKPKEKYGSY